MVRHGAAIIVAPSISGDADMLYRAIATRKQRHRGVIRVRGRGSHAGKCTAVYHHEEVRLPAEGLHREGDAEGKEILADRW
jgi:hypothetical protein